MSEGRVSLVVSPGPFVRLQSGRRILALNETGHNSAVIAPEVPFLESGVPDQGRRIIVGSTCIKEKGSHSLELRGDGLSDFRSFA